MTRVAVAALLVCGLLLATVHAEQWPQFRGLTAGSIPDSPGLPDRWSRTDNVVWTLDVPGRGWSSPVVWGDHVFITSVIDPREPAKPPRAGLYGGQGASAPPGPQRWVVYDVDYRTGTIRWAGGSGVLPALLAVPSQSEQGRTHSRRRAQHERRAQGCLPRA